MEIRESLYKERNKVKDMDSVVSRLIKIWNETFKNLYEKPILIMSG